VLTLALAVCHGGARRDQRRVRRTFSQLAAALVLSASLAACASNDISWTEEVKLHDGKIIQLKRRTELTSSGFPVQQRGFYRYHEFCYAPMQVHWKSKPEYTPEVFDIVNGKAYAKVSLGHDCTRCMLHGYPETDALYFRWDDGAWRKIDHGEYPAELRLNLLMGPAGRNASEDARGLVSLAEKENRQAGINYEFKLTGARGLNELPDTKGACNKCRGIRITTTKTVEVFLPFDSKFCQ